MAHRVACQHYSAIFNLTVSQLHSFVKVFVILSSFLKWHPPPLLPLTTLTTWVVTPPLLFKCLILFALLFYRKKQFLKKEKKVPCTCYWHTCTLFCKICSFISQHEFKFVLFMHINERFFSSFGTRKVSWILLVFQNNKTKRNGILSQSRYDDMPTILIDIMIMFSWSHSALQVSAVQITMIKTLLRSFHLLKTPIFLVLHHLFLYLYHRRESKKPKKKDTHSNHYLFTHDYWKHQNSFSSRMHNN